MRILVVASLEVVSCSLSLACKALTSDVKTRTRSCASRAVSAAADELVRARPEDGVLWERRVEGGRGARWREVRGVAMADAGRLFEGSSGHSIASI